MPISSCFCWIVSRRQSSRDEQLNWTGGGRHNISWLSDLLCLIPFSLTLYVTHQRLNSKPRICSIDNLKTANPTHVRAETVIEGGRTLIVTARNRIDEWAGRLRDTTGLKLLVYTEGIATRRKLGAHSLTQFDTVLTTFDVRSIWSTHVTLLK